MKFFHYLLLVSIALPVVGCGESGPELCPVTGTVTYQGKPLPLGTVMFIPENREAKAAVASIDENGHYQLKTVAGPYAVQIQMVARLRGQALTGEASKLNIPEVDCLIPEKYGNFQSSGLKAVVEIGENSSMDFPLK